MSTCFMLHVCDLLFVFIFIFIMINRIILWKQTHLLFCFLFEYVPLFLDDNVDEEFKKISNGKSAWFLANFSLALTTKVLLIKKCVLLKKETKKKKLNKNKWFDYLTVIAGFLADTAIEKSLFAKSLFNYSVLIIVFLVLLLVFSVLFLLQHYILIITPY